MLVAGYKRFYNMNGEVPRSKGLDASLGSKSKGLDASLGPNSTPTGRDDSGVFGTERHNSMGSEKASFSFKSFSYEVVQGWTHHSFASANFLSASLQDFPSPDRRSSAWLAGVNLQSMVLGTSVLGFPFAFMQAGIWAVPLVVIIGISTIISAGLLRDCLYQKSKKSNRWKRVRRTYVEVCTSAWPKYGKVVTEFVVFLGLLRNVIVLILLTNLIVEALKGVIRIDRGIITVVWALAVLPFLFIKRVSSLAWISFIGLSLYLIAIAAIVVDCLLHYASWSIVNLHFKFSLEKVGLAAGIIINSFSQHLSFPPVEGSMKKPKRFKATVFVTFAINIIVKIFLGISAVMTYGDTIDQSITGNLTDTRLAIPCNIAIAFFAYFTLPMQSFVVLDLIDSKFLPHFPVFYDANSWGWLFLSRSLVLTFGLLVAVLVPQFGLLVSFVGSIRGSLVSLVFPPVLYLVLFKRKASFMKKTVCVVVAAIGIILGGTGIYSSTKAVAKALV